MHAGRQILVTRIKPPPPCFPSSAKIQTCRRDVCFPFLSWNIYKRGYNSKRNDNRIMFYRSLLRALYNFFFLFFLFISLFLIFICRLRFQPSAGFAQGLIRHLWIDGQSGTTWLPRIWSCSSLQHSRGRQPCRCWNALFADSQHPARHQAWFSPGQLSSKPQLPGQSW